MAKKAIPRAMPAGADSKDGLEINVAPIAATPPVVTPQRELPGTQESPAGPEESWRRIASARAPAFDQSVPAYLLDDAYWFLDWNPAFDELVAGPMGLKRHRNHAEDFVRRLANVDEVYRRSKEVFNQRSVPLIDMEPLVLKTEKYGTIYFQKIAVQITDGDARLAAWSVFLNITRADRLDRLWADLRVRVEDDLNWSRYAISYDQLLLNFDDYSELLRHVASKLQNCKRCLDLGAGTGNSTIELLRAIPDGEVWAIESNHAMVQQLIAKIERKELESGSNIFGRLRVLKEDVERLDDLSEFLTPGSFDGAMMLNVLYALDDPERCIRNVFDLLSPGGKMVFSTPHKETNVDKLFARIREVLEGKNLFAKLRSLYTDARDRHVKLDQLIHRHTKQEIVGFVRAAGFRLLSEPENDYVNSVIVVEAEKP